jgi:cell division protein FtsI (penicillin-binding protein 3)
MSKARKYLSFSRHDLSRPLFHRGRSSFAGLMFTGAFLTLICRAAWVQCINDDFYQHQGDIRQVSDIELPASRGRIVDRNGRPLALNLPTRTLWLDAEAPGAPASPCANRLARGCAAHRPGSDRTRVCLTSPLRVSEPPDRP